MPRSLCRSLHRRHHRPHPPASSWWLRLGNGLARAQASAHYGLPASAIAAAAAPTICIQLPVWRHLRCAPRHRLPTLVLACFAAGITACWADRPLLQALHEVLQPPSANLLLVQWSRQQELLQVGLQLATHQPPLLV